MKNWMHELAAGLRGFGIEILAVMAGIVLAIVIGVVVLAVV